LLQVLPDYLLKEFFESPMIDQMLKLVNLPALVGGEVDVDREGIPVMAMNKSPCT